MGGRQPCDDGGKAGATTCRSHLMLPEPCSCSVPVWRLTVTLALSPPLSVLPLSPHLIVGGEGTKSAKSTMILAGQCFSLWEEHRCQYYHAIFRHIKDMTPDTVLIINLAFADLFYSAISLPFMFTTYYRLSRTVSRRDYSRTVNE
ncbi:hypothetical protein E2C01_051212 [Portunus trituberculatus]|uniref:Uncharacterized protein n=1 Tax=Portunus trituberculatus TaxID=210409 RepID=A0A5B7GIJ7_PORTR|nr:hypothetical protein [Portunus trituberculatus]